MNQLLIFALVAISHVMSEFAMFVYNGSTTCEYSAFVMVGIANKFINSDSFDWDKCYSPDASGSSIYRCHQDGKTSIEFYSETNCTNLSLNMSIGECIPAAYGISSSGKSMCRNFETLIKPEMAKFNIYYNTTCEEKSTKTKLMTYFYFPSKCTCL